MSIPQPNQDSEHFKHAELVEFARKIEMVASVNNDRTSNDLLAIVRAFTTPTLNAAEEARENIEALYLLAELRTDIFDFAVESGIGEENSVKGKNIQNEIDKMHSSLLDIKKQLHDLEVDKSELLHGIQIGAFGLNVSLGAIKDIIDQAKRETEKRGGVNLRFLSSLMRSASELAGGVWSKIKSMHQAVPRQAAEAVHRLTTSIASVASDAVVAYMRTLNEARRFRSRGYSLESRAIELNRIRANLIGLIEDFENFSPGHVDRILSSALCKFLYQDTRMLQHTDSFRSEISRNYVAMLELSSTEAHGFVLDKAKTVLDRLSNEILTLERQIEGKTE
ncbi:MAG: hypothetical protein ABJK54_05945 [Alphaproteobacteria bacterium]